MKVVLDTNIFISSFFGGNPKKVIDLWKSGKLILCLSSGILEEYIDVLQRLGLEGEKELEELLELLGRGFNVFFTRKTPQLSVVKDDPDDDKFVECAVKLEADYIISGDRALLNIEKYKGIKILSPKEFLITVK
jgi:putative PIN family toxin of toxin-antitoxin system